MRKILQVNTQVSAQISMGEKRIHFCKKKNLDLWKGIGLGVEFENKYA